jgi:hypothetical protein
VTLFLQKKSVHVYNAIEISNCAFYNSEIVNCTIFINPDMFEAFKKKLLFPFVNITGDQSIDCLPIGMNRGERQ